VWYFVFAEPLLYIQELTNTLNFLKITSHFNTLTFSVVAFLYIIRTWESRRKIQLLTDLFKWLYEWQVLVPRDDNSDYSHWSPINYGTNVLQHNQHGGVSGHVSPATGEKLGMGCHSTHMQEHGATVRQNRQHQYWNCSTQWQTTWWNYSHNTEADTNRNEVRGSRTHYIVFTETAHIDLWRSEWNIPRMSTERAENNFYPFGEADLESLFWESWPCLLTFGAWQMMHFCFPVTTASLVSFTAQPCWHDGTLVCKLSVCSLGWSVQ